MPKAKLKKKPKTKSYYKRQIDKLFSRYWREKIGHCERCDKQENLVVAHIITRGVIKLRWERKNIFVMCMGCHTFWAHKYPLQFTQFVIDKKGQDVHDWLIKESNNLKPLDINWYIRKFNNLQKKI